jgi:protein SCO1/2
MKRGEIGDGFSVRAVSWGGCRASQFAVTLLALAVFPAGAAASDRRLPPAFPQGGEQPLAALQDVDVIEHLGDRIPAGLAFRDPDGHKVELDALLGGRPLLVTLGYYRCPMLCNLVLDGLAKAMKGSGLAPGRDFQAVSISIDPNEDAQLARETRDRMLRSVGGDPDPGRWPFLLGDAIGSRALADAVGFKYAYDSLSRQFAHAAVAFVLTPDGRVSRYLYGVDVIARDFRLALVEAGGGRVGTSFDRVLLSCFKYDPINRRYAPYVMGFMRIGAGLVFVALATLMTVLWRKELVMRRRRVA